MSEYDFRWVDFIRVLQVHITTVVLLFVLIAIVYVLLMLIVKRSDLPSNRRRTIKTGVRRVVGVLSLLITIGFVVNAAVVASVNRVPRSDIDKSGVYQQIDSHLTNPDH